MSDDAGAWMVDGQERHPLPFDLDLLFRHPRMLTLRQDIKNARPPKGVYRVIHGSCQLDASGNGIAVGTEQPGGGRIWFVRAVAVFDAQNPATVSSAAQTVTAVPLGATTVATQNSNNVPVTVTVAGGTVTVIAINGITTNVTSGTFTLEPGWTIALTYSAPPTTFTTAATTTVITGTGGIYAEPTPPNYILGTFQPNPPDPNGVILPSFTGLPFSITFSNWVYKAWNQDNLYVVLTGVKGTSGQIGFMARVAEYYLEDVELMHT